MEKICWQITVAAFMQPLQYDLRDPAAKDTSITNAATARSNLDAAITMRSAETELQNTIELRATASEIVAPKTELQTAIPFTLRERSYSCKAQWNSIGNSSTSTTCNPIYIAGTILQLQITMEFCRPHMHEKQVKPHLQWGTDPTMIRTWSAHDPTTHETVSQPSHRRGRSSRFGDGLCMEKHRVSCICYLSKTHFVRDFLQNSIGNSSTSTTCNAICIAGTILQLQSTMDFHRQLIHQHHLQSHLHCGNDPTVANHNGILSTAHARKTGETPFTMRNRSDHDPTMIRTWSAHDPTTHETVSQPSHRRGRSSRFGDGLCMEKHRVSCICYLSKTHFVRDFLQNSIGNSSTSTTCNAICIAGTILQLQSTMEFHRQLIHQHHLQSHLHCGNDPTVANHNGILSTAHARKTGETPFTMRNRSDHDPTMIRTWSAHDPTTHETVSQPSHRRGRSSRFGDGLCMEKHRVSCICYLSKTHFVRDFLQNSIGNSSTSTTCNAILTLSLTNSFPDILKVTINSVPN